MLGNAVVILAFVVDKNLRHRSNYFFLNLAVSDFFVGVISIPLFIPHKLFNWKFENNICVFWLTTDYLLCTASVYNIVLISFDRYQSVSNAVSYRAQHTGTLKTVTLMVAVWVAAFLLQQGTGAKVQVPATFPGCSLVPTAMLLLHSPERHRPPRPRDDAEQVPTPTHSRCQARKNRRECMEKFWCPQFQKPTLLLQNYLPMSKVIFKRLGSKWTQFSMQKSWSRKLDTEPSLSRLRSCGGRDLCSSTSLTLSSGSFGKQEASHRCCAVASR
ncbi:hypothetical protein AB1E18_017170 [Capra hircus]